MFTNWKKANRLAAAAQSRAEASPVSTVFLRDLPARTAAQSLVSTAYDRRKKPIFQARKENSATQAGWQNQTELLLPAMQSELQQQQDVFPGTTSLQITYLGKHGKHGQDRGFTVLPAESEETT